MADLGAFPDVEGALQGLFSDLVPTGNVGTVTPSNLQDSLPFIRVMRIGGDDDRITDSATVNIDSLTANNPRSSGRDLAESIRQRLISGPNVIGSVTIDFSSTATAPNEVPWSDDQTIRRFTATYRITARR